MAGMSVPVPNGFQPAANMVQGYAAAAQAAVAAALAAPEFVDLAGAAAEGDGAEAAPAANGAAANAPPMRWNNNTSGFVLRRMAQIVSDGSRTDKTYKDRDVNAVAKTLREYSGVLVSPTQVYNHLRKWKQKWAKIAKLKDLSGANFDDDSHAIMLEQDHFLGHCKDHPKDAEFLNTPIRFYVEMEAIFGSTLATGRFALGSSAPLGVNNADSVAAKIEGNDFTSPSFDTKPFDTKPFDGKPYIDLGEGSKATTPQSGTAGVKRKRNFSEEEILMMTNMTDAVNNVANAMIKTGAAHVDPDLYLAVMETPDFSTEALIVAYTYLLENKAVATGFVTMSAEHRAVWLRTYLAKNYYL
ncbi:unnamed protein product [Urochloa humidicola]